MATGIFVIGRNLSLEGYLDISRKFGVRTRMQFYKPIEVGLPLHLNNPEKNGAQVFCLGSCKIQKNQILSHVFWPAFQEKNTNYLVITLKEATLAQAQALHDQSCNAAQASEPIFLAGLQDRTLT